MANKIESSSFYNRVEDLPKQLIQVLQTQTNMLGEKELSQKLTKLIRKK